MTDPLSFSRERTPSGLTVFTQHRPLPWYAIDVVVMAGDRHSLPGKPGTAHLLEHLISMGNVGYPRKEPTELYRWAVAQGFDMNWGETHADATVYGGRAASRDLWRLVKYLHALTLRPLLETDLEHELEIIRDERTEDGEFRLREAQRAAGKALFGDHPLAYATAWPEDDILYGMTYDDVRAFHAAHYGCENMAVVAVGDMEDDTVLHALDHYFKDPSDRAFTRPAPQRPPAVGGMPSPRSYVCKKEGGELESIQATYSWVAPRSSVPADERLFVRTLSSLLHDRVREKACAAYSVDVDVSRLRDCSVYSIDVMSPADRFDKARETLESALEDDAALADALKSERAEIMLQTELLDETVEDAMNLAVHRVISDGSPEPLRDILDRYRELTPDDIVGMRRRHLALDRAYVEHVEH